MNLASLLQKRSSTRLQPTARSAGVLACAAFVAACGGGSGPSSAPDGELRATIGPKGGELVGQTATAFEGVHLVIPAGALAADTEIIVRPTSSTTALPKTAVGCGQGFDIEPAGLKLAAPATLTLPFDESTVTDQNRFDDEVKVWILEGSKWGQQAQTDSAAGRVTIALDAMTDRRAGRQSSRGERRREVQLPREPEVRVLHRADSERRATRAQRCRPTSYAASLNDGLFLRGSNIKPGLAFDLFTVENSQLLANGTVNPDFKNFGLAWYQSDLEANNEGEMRASIRTILLDQIFGFDPGGHAAADEHVRGGLLVQRPEGRRRVRVRRHQADAIQRRAQGRPAGDDQRPRRATGLGPLCTKPDTSVSPARCSP